MGNYATHHYEVYSHSDKVLEKVKNEIMTWRNDKESLKSRVFINFKKGENPLKFSYDQRVLHDEETMKYLSSRYPDAKFHIRVTMEEGPESYYVALSGEVAWIDLDSKIKKELHGFLAEIFHRDLFQRDVIEKLLDGFEDDKIPWFDAAFRLILHPDFKKDYRKDQGRICPECIKKFNKINEGSENIQSTFSI